MLVATFPDDAELSREQWKALVVMEKGLGVTLKESGAACKHFAAVAEERGGPQDPDGADLSRYLNRRERAEFDAALTRSLDASSAATALGRWINAHHDVRSAAVARRAGVEWPKVDVDQFLDIRADVHRLRRALH